MKYVMMAAVIGGTITAPAGTADYQRGWCDGVMHAVDLLEQNRSHYRALLGVNPETSQQALDRIYSTKWGTQPLALLMADGVDLYVMLPITGCSPP